MMGEPMEPRRTAPASSSPNNQDVFVWSLYQLGGAEHDVDVEAIYLLSFELAPARLGWRTRPELPDYKKTSKALQAVEARTHVGLVHRTSPHLRRLTTAGTEWIEQNRAILERNYGGGAPVQASLKNAHERRRRSVRASAAFGHWSRASEISLPDLADALECTTASPRSVWNSRVIELQRAARILDDGELADFADAASRRVARDVED
jgi:hypothetical protein